jgi:hypothetical protein
MVMPGSARGWASCTHRFPSRWNPRWQTISVGLAGDLTGVFGVVFAFAAAGFGASHLPLLMFSVVPEGQRQALLTSTLPPVQANGETPQEPAATASAAQHRPFTSIEGGEQATFG